MMEGGAWGIVIIVSAFMIQVLTFGTTASIGVYNIELLDYFEGSSVGVSLIGSINFGVYLGSGPIVSFLMTKFCYRKIALCGSVLVAVGLVSLPFLPYIPSMCLFFGVLTGFGNCCTYIPSHVLSGLYYDKYRSIATGISTSGSGLGSAIMPVIVGFLIDTYSWKGSLFVLAGLNLHLFIFAALLRYPHPPHAGSLPESPTITGAPSEDTVKESEDETKFLVTPFTRRREERKLDTSKKKTSERPKSYSSCTSNTLDANYDNFGVDLSELEYIDKISIHTGQSSADNISEHLKPSASVCFADVPRKETNIVKRDRKYSGRYRLTDDVDNPREKHRASFMGFLYPHSLSSHSLFAIGSRGSCVIHIENFQHFFDVNRSLSDMERSSLSLTPRASKHIYIFTNYGFNIYFLSNIMWNAGYAIIQSFAPEFLKGKGLTLMEAAWLSGTFGFASFVGGVMGGICGNIESINRQGLYMVACIIMGAVIIVFPQFQHFLLYSVLLIVAGLAFGVILGLLIVVLTDLVGVESLGNGLGYLMLSNGLGAFLGPPIASLLKNETGGFESGILLAGALCIVGGLIMLFMPCRRCCKLACKRGGEKQEDVKMVAL